MIDMTDIGGLIIRLIEALAIAFLIPWLKEKFDTEKLQRAGKLVRFAVYAAEQLYGGGHGAEKKEYVTAFLEARNLKLDLDTIDRMIEATVLEMSAALEGEEKPPDADWLRSPGPGPAGEPGAIGITFTSDQESGLLEGSE